MGLILMGWERGANMPLLYKCCLELLLDLAGLVHMRDGDVGTAVEARGALGIQHGLAGLGQKPFGGFGRRRRKHIGVGRFDGLSRDATGHGDDMGSAARFNRAGYGVGDKLGRSQGMARQQEAGHEHGEFITL